MAPAYTYTTLGTARQQLANRLFDSTQTFWQPAELTGLIQEALRTWNALTSYWRNDFTFPLQQNVTFFDFTDPVAMPGSLRLPTLHDTDLYSVMAYHLLEPPSGIASLQFTQDDFMNAVARRRDEILAVTGCTLTVRLVPAAAGRTLLPDSVIDIRRVAYLPTINIGTPYGIGLYGGATPQGTIEPIVVTYTLVATISGSNMNYVLTSNSSLFPLTASWTIPINPVPSSFTLGQSFYLNPPIPNLIINGISVNNDYLFFYNIALLGSLRAQPVIGPKDFNYSGPQLYSGPESAPTMLAGTFTISQNVSTGGFSSAGVPGGPYGGNIRVGANASVLWPEDSFAETSFNRQYTLTPAGTPPAAPSVYLQSTEPPISFDTDQPPSYAGSYELLTVEAGPALSVGNPSLLSVPDDWTHVIKWGALADLLSRESNAKDPARATYCNQRYKMGLALLSKASVLLALRVANVPLQIDSITAGDLYHTGWERDTPGQPTVAYHAGLNLVAVSPVSDVGPYTITATVVQNAPVPASDADFLQVSRGDLDAILDYAQHLAAFKMGGLEFTATLPLFQRFLAAAASYGLKLAELGEYTSVIFAQSQRDAEMHPRFAPAPASATDGAA
jgi:hypothetical protein